ncbi:MAG: peptide chain release factor N(5)-glutamine methyltransferase, partial [Alphaproteobacteria bacterium]
DVADNPRAELRRLVEVATGLSAVEQIASAETVLSDEQIQSLTELVARRQTGEPLARILGRREFWGLELLTQGVTLDPRPDTETLIEQALTLCRAQPPKRILDLGTGSGALLLALLSEFPGATGFGVDQSAATLETAALNAERLGLDERAAFAASDWFSAVEGDFDLIVSNPPYIPTKDLADLDVAVRDFDAPEALDGGEDGLVFYRLTLEQAGAYLRDGGLLILELGIGQAADVQQIGESEGWTMAALCEDLAGIPRAIALTRNS